MTLAFLLAVQVATAPPPAAPAAIDFDLARLPPRDHGPGDGAQACARQEGEEILVCGYRPRGGDYPFAAMARRFGPAAPLVAEAGLGGNLTGRVYVEGVQFPNGTVSNRVMVGIRLPF